jgi:hypothetical protein
VVDERESDASAGSDPEQTEPIGREAPPTMPSRTAYLLTFVAVVVAGVFGGVIGYGLADISCTGDDCTTSRLLAVLIGSTFAAGGVGIVAVLVLRAMAEWKRNPTPRPKGPRRS